jgi:hypothetical protein
MSEAITINRREKRKASGKGTSLLYDLEDDFSDIEKNFKLETRATLTNEIKADTKSITNWLKADDEVDQKQVKSGLKVGQDLLGNVDQKQVKSGSKVGQENQEDSMRKIKSGLKVGQQVGQSFNQKQVKSGLKVGQNQDISQVIGLQKNLLNFIFNNCVNNGSKESPYYSAGHLAHYLEVSNDSIKSAIRQLRIKGLLEKTNFKDGRGGGTKFLIPDLIYRDLLSESRLKVDQKQVTSGLKVGLEVGQQVGQSLPSSSSLINTTTNYKAGALDENKIQLTDGLITVGFNQGHIEQLLRDSNLGPEEIQNSLNAFAFDLGFEDVKRKVRSPIGLIMKLLKNGQAYISEKGYESEEDRLYRELIERAEKKNEEKKNLQAKLLEVKFEEWLDKISDDDKRNLAEPIGEFMGIIHRQELKEYFKREVYNANDIH